MLLRIMFLRNYCFFAFPIIFFYLQKNHRHHIINSRQKKVNNFSLNFFCQHYSILEMFCQKNSSQFFIKHVYEKKKVTLDCTRTRIESSNTEQYRPAVDPLRFNEPLKFAEMFMRPGIHGVVFKFEP